MASNEVARETDLKFWDTVGVKLYETEWVQNLVKQAGEELTSRADWIGMYKIGEEVKSSDHPVQILDYGCGNGTISRILLPYASEIRGIDVSGEMVKEYNRLAEERGIFPPTMRAIQGNLTDLSQPVDAAIDTIEFSNFDLVLVCMALHHMSKPEMMIEKLFEHLRPHGILVIVDMAAEEHQGTDILSQKSQHVHTHSPRGFLREEIISMLQGAGGTLVDYVLFEEKAILPKELGSEAQGFIVRATKGE